MQLVGTLQKRMSATKEEDAHTKKESTQGDSGEWNECIRRRSCEPCFGGFRNKVSDSTKTPLIYFEITWCFSWVIFN